MQGVYTDTHWYWMVRDRLEFPLPLNQRVAGSSPAYLIFLQLC